MNLLPIFASLKSEKLHWECSIKSQNPNILTISWSNTSNKDNVIWESYDRFYFKEETRSVFFKSSCELRMDFDKILHLWDNETDEKYSDIRKRFITEKGAKRAIMATFPKYLDKVIPIIESKDYDLLKDFFYDYRGMIGLDIIGL
jgi:hypothetical protein